MPTSDDAEDLFEAVDDLQLVITIAERLLARGERLPDVMRRLAADARALIAYISELLIVGDYPDYPGLLRVCREVPKTLEKSPVGLTTPDLLSLRRKLSDELANVEIFMHKSLTRSFAPQHPRLMRCLEDCIDIAGGVLACAQPSAIVRKEMADSMSALLELMEREPYSEWSIDTDTLRRAMMSSSAGAIAEAIETMAHIRKRAVGTSAQLPPLSSVASIVYEMLLSVDPWRGVLPKDITANLMDNHNINLDESTLRGRILKELVPYGITTKKRVGWSIPADRRPAKQFR